MPNDVLRGFSTRATPQRQPAGKATVKNDAGGYNFAITELDQAKRFIMFGADGGTFYVRPQELAAENAKVIQRLAKSDPVTLVDTIVDISTNGRAPKQNPAIFALALITGEADPAGKAYALAALPKVCRTLSHLYLFLTYAEGCGSGWGPAMKKAVAKWLNDRPADGVAYQAMKYRQREGFNLSRVLRLSRPAPVSASHDALFEYLLLKNGGIGTPSDRALHTFGDKAYSPHSGKQIGQTSKWEDIPKLVPAFLEMQDAPISRAVSLIGEYGFSWEMLPDRLVNEPAVWEALLDKGVPPTALMRQLPRLTRLGLTTGQVGAKIVAQLTDVEVLKRGRVHPINMLVALRTYASGRSARGAADRDSASWNPTPNVIDALNDGFYIGYGAVEPANKITLFASDTSYSMTVNAVGNLPLQALEVAGALALVTANVEQNVTQLGFNQSVWPMTISKRQRLDDVLRYMRQQPNGGTDCSLPMRWAIETQTYVDTFVISTDEESWFGPMHPWEALRRYRDRVNPNARLVVLVATPRGNSIADPDDAGSLQIAGFDTSVPQLITNFSAGRL